MVVISPFITIVGAQLDWDLFMMLPIIGGIVHLINNRIHPGKRTWNLEPENHPFEKETHLPNLHFGVPCSISRGVKKLANSTGASLPYFCPTR